MKQKPKYNYDIKSIIIRNGLVKAYAILKLYTNNLLIKN